MLTELDQCYQSVCSNIEFTLVSPHSTIQKNSIPLFPLPETSHINLVQQYSQRFKQNQTKLHKSKVRMKIKTKSRASYSNSVKKQEISSINQILQLPISFKIQSSSIWKEKSKSFLLKTKNPAEFCNKLPRIPKMVSTGEIVNKQKQLFKDQLKEKSMDKQKNIQLMIREKLLQTQFKANKLKFQYKWCQIKESQLPKIQKKQKQAEAVESKQAQIQMQELTEPSPQKLKTVSKSLAPTGTSFYQTNSVSRTPQVSKQHIKKQILNIVNPILVKPTPKPTPIKYKKGYLIYDLNCLNCFRNRNQIPQRQVLLPSHPPEISAKDYCIIDSQTLKPIYIHKQKNHPIQIASLTKIVTCLLTILACKKYDINPYEYRCRVSQEASSMIGTSAELLSGDLLTIHQLLHGLMLPSGNDASVTLAENIGKIIQRKKKIQNPVNPILTFIKQMNILYKQIIEEQEYDKHLFKNPSGLIFNPNLTTIEQITIFATVACKNQLFYEIINTKVLQLNIMNEKVGISRKMVWKNTNKLLWKGWEGVKTGTTENAGHCFIGKYENNIYALLDCATLQKRFNDAEVLKKWICRERSSNEGNNRETKEDS